MAERQQTFAWNHRNVCPGLTGTFKHTNIIPGITRNYFLVMSYPVWHKADVISSFLQLLGMAFSMTLYQQIHRAGKKYDA